MPDIDVDSLAAKIIAAIGKARGSARTDGHDDDRGNPPNHVPYHRLQESRQQVATLRGQLDELQGQVEQLTTAQKAQIDGLRNEAATQVATLGKRHQEDLTLMDHGFTDPLGRQTLRSAWDGMPKDSRGKSPAEWWQSQVEASKAHAADPEANAAPGLPRALTPYLPQPEAKAAPKSEGSGNGGSGSWGNFVNPDPPQRRAPGGVNDAPVDQGWDKFLAGLPD